MSEAQQYFKFEPFDILMIISVDYRQISFTPKKLCV